MSPPSMKGMKLEPIIQSEVSQKEKDKYHILTHIYMEYIYVLVYIYMEYRKMVLKNLFAGHQKSKRVPEKHLFLLY